MYEIVFLTTEDRKKLEELNSKYMSALTPEERTQIFSEITEIETRRKALRDCNHEECMLLKEQLYDKFRKFAKIGRQGQARQFNVMLQTVDFRLRLLALESKKEEAEKKKERENQKVVEAEKRVLRREKNASAKSVWSIAKNLDDDD